MGRAYNVIDADGHILEPLTLWNDYMDPKFRDRAPKLFEGADGRLAVAREAPFGERDRDAAVRAVVRRAHQIRRDRAPARLLDRDLSREQLRAVIRAGLQRTAGNYRMMVELFNMPAGDYKRFLSFLRKHDCQVPFHAFRAVRPRPAVASIAEVSLGEAAGM